MRATNRNFAIGDDTHTALKILAAQRRATIGNTIQYLLEVHRAIANREDFDVQLPDGSYESIRFE